MSFRRTRIRVGLAAIAIMVACGAAAAAPAGAHRVQWMNGFDAPGTPARFDKVGVLKFGPASARNVLVLNSGTSAGSAYFGPMARTLVEELPGWQVWAVERRENLLEDQSVFQLSKERRVTAEGSFDYYLRWLVDSSITNHSG